MPCLVNKVTRFCYICLLARYKDKVLNYFTKNVFGNFLKSNDNNTIDRLKILFTVFTDFGIDHKKNFKWMDKCLDTLKLYL